MVRNRIEPGFSKGFRQEREWWKRREDKKVGLAEMDMNEIYTLMRKNQKIARVTRLRASSRQAGREG